jgi:hypothetical protein
MSSQAARIHHINWRRETIYPALAVAETCLITPWLLAFFSLGGSVQPERVAGACLALILGTLYLARAMGALRISTLIQRALVLSGILGLSAWIVRQFAFNGPQWADQDWHALLDPNILINLVPGTLIVLLSVTWLCWRGLRLADRPLRVEDTALGFHIGILVLALAAVLYTAPEMTTLIAVFFFSQLFAMALTRVETIAIERGGRRSPFTGWWLIMLISATGSVVLIAGVVSAAVLGVPPDQLLFWLMPFLALITLPFALIALPFMGLLTQIVKTILSVAMLVINQWMTFVQQVQAILGRLFRFQPPPIVIMALRVIGYGILTLIVLMVLLVLINVVRMVGRRSARRENEQDEQHEYIWSGQTLLNKLRARLLSRLARLRHLASIAGRLGASGLFAALTIRRIYAQTVKLAASRGYPRPAAHTPYEHLATLQQAFPGCETDVTQMTEAYVGVHYGELPERAEALAEIRAAFERVKAQAETAKKHEAQVKR